MADFGLTREKENNNYVEWHVFDRNIHCGCSTTTPDRFVMWLAISSEGDKS